MKCRRSVAHEMNTISASADPRMYRGMYSTQVIWLEPNNILRVDVILSPVDVRHTESPKGAPWKAISASGGQRRQYLRGPARKRPIDFVAATTDQVWFGLMSGSSMTTAQSMGICTRYPNSLPEPRCRKCEHTASVSGMNKDMRRRTALGSHTSHRCVALRKLARRVFSRSARNLGGLVTIGSVPHNAERSKLPTSTNQEKGDKQNRNPDSSRDFEPI
jgi:hypothetical protein